MFRHAFSFVRSYRQFSSKEGLHLLAERLSDRSLIRISGDLVSDYLQGLVTNDVKHLECGGSCMFAMFLNTKGRVLFDSIIYHGSKNELYLECDANVKSEFISHLKMFKVRRKLSVDDMQDQYSLWTVNFKSIVHDIFVHDEPVVPANIMKNNFDYLQKLIPFQVFLDPRIVVLGTRVLVPNESNLVKNLKDNNMNVTEEDFYRRLRYRLGVGEGISELPCGNCFPLEANCDYLHGISFHKGCYIGQELTARTYHTGVIRKRIMPLTFSANKSVPKFHSPITVDTQGKVVGKFLSRHGNNGIGLLRIDDVLKENQLTVSDSTCSTFRPFWWPVEAPKGRPS